MNKLISIDNGIVTVLPQPPIIDRFRNTVIDAIELAQQAEQSCTSVAARVHMHRAVLALLDALCSATAEMDQP